MSTSEQARAYLCVDRFIADLLGARALSSALETGVVDALAATPHCTVAGLLQSMRQETRFDVRGLGLLLGMLRASGVLDVQGGRWCLSPAFEQALVYRDLLEAKLQMAHWVAPDFLHLFTALLVEPQRFMAQARLFKLFAYERCFDDSPQNRAHTAQWMRYTTALTRYEAQACLEAFDISRHQRMLDVGGNSGEFVLQLCRAHTALQAVVYDLPLVCEIGRAHVAHTPEAARIGFHALDLGQPALPHGFDLISFKSMLHDWPEAHMDDFLRRAYAALQPGGSVLIYERGEPEPDEVTLSYGQLPLLLFFRSYRRTSLYEHSLIKAGFHTVRVRAIRLDMPFVLISALK